MAEKKEKIRFFDYMKYHTRGVLAFCLMCLTSFCIYALYRLPLAAVGYASAVCGMVGLLFLASDYLRFRKKHQKLEIQKKEILTTMDGLPKAAHVIEREYQELIGLLYEQKLQFTAQQEEKYRDLVEYYTMWAHQIKTPIAASRLILQSAERGEMNAGDVQELKEELRRIEQYTEMVMCYLRLDSGASDYLIREYDLDKIVRQAVRGQASQFIRKRLTLNYEPLDVRVVTDEKWLLFVIGQVLSNALKYTAEGSISIVLEQPKTLCIRDTGIGIAPEDIPRIFEKGYTGGNGRMDKKASGIGLYLCRRICRNLGHKITAVSEPGTGTEIRIDLKNAEPYRTVR